MREIINKIGRFFEGHVEKIVIIVVGILCAWFFFTNVLLSNNVVVYKNEKMGPGKIDENVNKDAQLLETVLGRKISPDTPAYEPKLKKYSALIDLSIDNVGNVVMPEPSNLLAEDKIGYQYELPTIGKVTNVAVGYIRAAAYVPTEEVNEENTYDQASNEVNDIDLITVEAELDYERVLENFYDSFVDQVKEDQWADTGLAAPVFAAVNLQRSQLNANGQWSDWQNVSRSRVEPHQELFEVKGDQEILSAGGLKVQMLKFSDALLRLDLLQPLAYQIASADDKWLPPRFHQQFLDARAKDARTERLESSTSEDNTSNDTSTGRGNRGSSRYGTTSSGQTSGSDTTSGRSGGRTRTGRSTTDTTSSSSSSSSSSSEEITEATDAVLKDFQEILLRETTDFSKLREPIVFWAFDDTAGPGKTYRYRIRLGFFNPVADKNSNNTILWSDFSDITEPVVVPEKLYFFTRSIQETAKTATVTVYKYQLGYWRSNDFVKVGLGDMIGDIVETELDDSESLATGVMEPDFVDYRTGAVLVDLAPVADWSGTTNLRNRSYFELLYSFGGDTIEHMPVTTYLTDDMKNTLRNLETLSKVTKKPLANWDSTTREMLFESLTDN